MLPEQITKNHHEYDSLVSLGIVFDMDGSQVLRTYPHLVDWG